jgi:predicted alpha/beta superfamily hydrolase
MLAASLNGLAQTAGAGPPWPAQVSVPSSYRIKLDSSLSGESYTLFIRVPVTPAPPQGYPVIYILDGDYSFGLASDVSLSIGNDPARAPVVVAIGHGLLDDMEALRRYSPRKPPATAELNLFDVGGAMNALRMHDYTLPVALEHRAPDWTGLTPPGVGGVDTFLKVLETEIKPRVEAQVRINRANQALFGHSIAGLAVLRALFAEPEAFRTFVAASPSIWWDADAVLADERKLADAVRRHAVAPRVLITVGAGEPDSPNPPASFIASLPADRAESLGAYVRMASRWSGMVSGARQLAERLASVPGAAPYRVQFVLFEDEDHASVLPAAVSRGMWFAFAQ